ncbi:hypothetical protein ABW20_dc0104441 [Dactylellina cionopaga]|nr:hypothetical protein ABW20_dc0104441 [Dactylellina cionopaga]
MNTTAATKIAFFRPYSDIGPEHNEDMSADIDVMEVTSDCWATVRAGIGDDSGGAHNQQPDPYSRLPEYQLGGLFYIVVGSEEGIVVVSVFFDDGISFAAISV